LLQFGVDQHFIGAAPPSATAALIAVGATAQSVKRLVVGTAAEIRIDAELFVATGASLANQLSNCRQVAAASPSPRA